MTEEGEVVGRVEHVVLEARRKRGEFLLKLPETRLPGFGELRATEAEIAQFVIHEAALRGGEPRERGGRGKRLESTE